MKRTGICSICAGLAQPAFSCSMCGMIVCGHHYDMNAGLCKPCAAKVRPQ